MKMSRADRNPWLVKMNKGLQFKLKFSNVNKFYMFSNMLLVVIDTHSFSV